MMLLLALTVSSFAIEDGENINFTSRHSNGATIFNSGDYVGTCCEIGVDPSPSGSARVTRVGSSSTTAKIAYRYGYEQGWINNSSVYPGFANVTYAQTLMSLIQCSQMGRNTWASRATEHLGDNVINTVLNLYDSISSSSVQIPNNFEVYACDAGNNQDFVIWRYSPTGSLRITKNLEGGGANRSFTFRVTVEGANGTYSGVSFTNGVATVNVTSGNMLTISDLPANAAYSVEEIDIPNGYRLAGKTGDVGTIAGDETKIATFTNSVSTGKLKLKKASDNSSITG